MSTLYPHFDDESMDRCPFCNVAGDLAHNVVKNGSEYFLAWACLRCGFAGGEHEAMPMAWALRFYLLRLGESWNGYGEPPPMDRDKHAEQVQAKRDALALLEGLGAKLKPLRKSPAHIVQTVDPLAGGQRNLGPEFGSPKKKPRPRKTPRGYSAP